MEFCGIIAYYFQTSFLQSATGLETFLSFFKGRAFPSSSTYLSISSSISFLFSTWEENKRLIEELMERYIDEEGNIKQKKGMIEMLVDWKQLI